VKKTIVKNFQQESMLDGDTNQTISKRGWDGVAGWPRASWVEGVSARVR